MLTTHTHPRVKFCRFSSTMNYDEIFKLQPNFEKVNRITAKDLDINDFRKLKVPICIPRTLLIPKFSSVFFYDNHFRDTAQF